MAQYTSLVSQARPVLQHASRDQYSYTMIGKENRDFVQQRKEDRASFLLTGTNQEEGESQVSINLAEEAGTSQAGPTYKWPGIETVMEAYRKHSKGNIFLIIFPGPRHTLQNVSPPIS